MGSAVLLRDAGGRILLVEPAYKDYWELPGGAVDADESPYDAAVRELREELGLSVTPGRLLVVDWAPPRANRTEGVMFVYDGGLLHPAAALEIHLPPDELRGWAWSTLAEAQRRLSALLARRAAAALEAVSGGGSLSGERQLGRLTSLRRGAGQAVAVARMRLTPPEPYRLSWTPSA